MRRVFNDALISIGALAILLVALVSIDDRVRVHVTRVIWHTSPADVADASAELGGIGPILVAAVRDQSVAHAPLMIFVVAAVALVLCMLRT